MIDSNYVTQNQRIDDLEDVAYLKKRVFELEEKVAKLESLIHDNTQRKRNKNMVTAFLGYVPIEKSSDDFSESIGE